MTCFKGKTQNNQCELIMVNNKIRNVLHYSNQGKAFTQVFSPNRNKPLCGIYILILIPLINSPMTFTNIFSKLKPCVISPQHHYAYCNFMHLQLQYAIMTKPQDLCNLQTHWKLGLDFVSRKQLIMPYNKQLIDISFEYTVLV